MEKRGHESSSNISKARFKLPLSYVQLEIGGQRGNAIQNEAQLIYHKILHIFRHYLGHSGEGD